MPYAELRASRRAYGRESAVLPRRCLLDTSHHAAPPVSRDGVQSMRDRCRVVAHDNARTTRKRSRVCRPECHGGRLLRVWATGSCVLPPDGWMVRANDLRRFSRAVCAWRGLSLPIGESHIEARPRRRRDCWPVSQNGVRLTTTGRAVMLVAASPRLCQIGM